MDERNVGAAMTARICDQVEDRQLSFAVVLAKCGGKFVLCRHRERSSWEFPGGRREKGEHIEETARRELWEESGALDFDLAPLFPYAVTDGEGGERFGMLYAADVRAFDRELRFEIGEVRLAEALPENWTYPGIQPVLLREAARRGAL